MPEAISRNAANRDRVYDTLAPVYRQLHEQFLRISGGEAQSAVVGALTPMLVPGLRVLDAGCADGGLARHLLSVEPDLDLAMVDASPRMIALSGGLPARRSMVRSENLVPHGSFDVAVVEWLIETTPEPGCAIRELFRCVKSGGWVFLAFCANRDDADIIDRMASVVLKWRGTGRFLDPVSVKGWVRNSGARTIRAIPCHGPTVAIVARKDGGS